MSEDKVWFVSKSIQQAQYMNKVNSALIPGKVKDFLRYIASKATWKHTTKPSKSYTPCFASQDTIEIQMGRSRDYVTTAKKMAIELDWIVVMEIDGYRHEIYPAIGKDDLSIKRREKRVRVINDHIKPVMD